MSKNRQKVMISGRHLDGSICGRGFMITGDQQRFVDVEPGGVHLESIRRDLLAEWSHVMDDSFHLHWHSSTRDGVTDSDGTGVSPESPNLFASDSRSA